MFRDYVFEKSPAQYSNHILLIDNDALYKHIDYTTAFSAHGFEIAIYENDLKLRIEYQEIINNNASKLVIIAKSDYYIPYDIYRKLSLFDVSWPRLFPRLNANAVKEKTETELDLLCHIYAKNYNDWKSESATEQYFQEQVFSSSNIQWYLSTKLSLLKEYASTATDYRDWFSIAEEKASLDLLAIQNEYEINSSDINRFFQEYLLREFGQLSQMIDKESPVLVSKAMEYMHDNSERFIIIVMDGMSEFDWRILATSFEGIPYEQAAAFAMIPSTTSISRQCLLSNKYPSQLIEPWKQNKEKIEFIECAKRLGFSDSQIGYERGYNASFNSFVRCGAVIINDVDDMVHAQMQGKVGMYYDIKLLAEQRKLRTMVRRFLEKGFDVYISADHGNTLCTGLGRLTGSGVEVETKSHKMIVLKDFANKNALAQKYRLIEYPKYYLPKEYDYLICGVEQSLDIKNETVMTHGGMSIDEVVVPFIKIKAGISDG